MIISLASNLTSFKEIAEMVKELDKTGKRMDRLDSIIHEYLRANRKTMEYLSEKLGCAPSTLWRYSRKTDCFRKMPIDIFGGVCRMANVSNEDLRYILGLPTGKADEET